MTLHVHPIDLAIVVVYMLGVVALGLWVGRNNAGISDYAVGGRSLPWWLVLFSVVATETSTVTFLSIPGVSYSGNLAFLQLPLGYIVGRYLVAALLLPRYFQGELFTSYQVLHRRFGGLTKRTASLLFVVTRSLADGLRLYLTAIVLHAMTDMSMSTAIVTIGLATIVYTFFGGMKAVVWTDFIQFGVYVAGALLAGWVVLANEPQGISSFLETAKQAGKFDLFDFSWSFSQPYTFLAGLIGGAFLTFGTHGTDQLTVQRLLSSRSQREAARALTWSGWVVAAQFALFLLLGIGLWGFYQGRDFAAADSVMATFIVEEMPVGVVGVTLAAVFAAAMSTLSSSLNSSATATVADLLARDPKNRPGDRADDVVETAEEAETASRRSMTLTRIWTVVFGGVQMSVALFAASQGLQRSVVDLVLAIAGFVTGIILGVFFLGVFTKRVEEKAALIGMLGGMTILTAIKFTTPLAWPWFAVVGSLGTFAVGLLAHQVDRTWRRWRS